MASIGDVSAEVSLLVNNFCKNNSNLKEDMSKLDENEAKSRKIYLSRTFTQIFEENKGYEFEISKYLEEESFSGVSGIINEKGSINVDVVKGNIASIINPIKDREQMHLNLNSQMKPKNDNVENQNNILDVYKNLKDKTLAEIEDYYKNKYASFPEGHRNEMAKNMAKAVRNGMAEEVINSKVIDFNNINEKQKNIIELSKKYNVSLLVADQIVLLTKAEITDNEEFLKLAKRKTYKEIYENFDETGELAQFLFENDENIRKIQTLINENPERQGEEILRILEDLERQGVFGDKTSKEIEILYTEAQIQVEYIKEKELDEQISAAVEKGDTKRVEQLKTEKKRLGKIRDNRRKENAREFNREKQTDKQGTGVDENAERIEKLDEESIVESETGEVNFDDMFILSDVTSYLQQDSDEIITSLSDMRIPMLEESGFSEESIQGMISEYQKALNRMHIEERTDYTEFLIEYLESQKLDFEVKNGLEILANTPMFIEQIPTILSSDKGRADLLDGLSRLAREPIQARVDIERDMDQEFDQNAVIIDTGEQREDVVIESDVEQVQVEEEAQVQDDLSENASEEHKQVVEEKGFRKVVSMIKGFVDRLSQKKLASGQEDIKGVTANDTNMGYNPIRTTMIRIGESIQNFIASRIDKTEEEENLNTPVIVSSETKGKTKPSDDKEIAGSDENDRSAVRETSNDGLDRYIVDGVIPQIPTNLTSAQAGTKKSDGGSKENDDFGEK